MSRNKVHDSIDNYDVVYKKIPGCDLDYFITTNGMVWSTSRKNGIERFMKTHLNKTGYPCVGLKMGGKQKILLVHRLVAQAFIPNPENKPYINHKDGTRDNNNVDNLEWCTQKENVYHAIHVLHRWTTTEKQRKTASIYGKLNRKLTMDDAIEIRRLYRSGEYSSIQLSKMFGLSKGCVLRIIHNKSYREEIPNV